VTTRIVVGTNGSATGQVALRGAAQVANATDAALP
jgi:hypothetical protein